MKVSYIVLGNNLVFISETNAELKWVFEQKDIDNACAKIQYLPSQKLFIVINDDGIQLSIKLIKACDGKLLGSKLFRSEGYFQGSSWILTPITGTDDFWLIPQGLYFINTFRCYRVYISSNSVMIIKELTIYRDKQTEYRQILFAGGVEKNGINLILVCYWYVNTHDVYITFYDSNWKYKSERLVFSNVDAKWKQSWLVNGLKEIKLDLDENNHAWATVPLWVNLEDGNCSIYSIGLNDAPYANLMVNLGTHNRDYNYKNMVYSTIDNSYIGWADYILLSGQGLSCDMPIKIKNIIQLNEEDFNFGLSAKNRLTKPVFNLYENIMSYTESTVDTHCVVTDNGNVVIFQRTRPEAVILVDTLAHGGNGALAYQTKLTSDTKTIELDGIDDCYAANYRDSDKLKELVRLGHIASIIEHFRVDSDYYFNSFITNNYDECYKGELSAKLTLTKAFDNVPIDCMCYVVPGRITIKGFKAMQTKCVSTSILVTSTYLDSRTPSEVSNIDMIDFIYTYRNVIFQELPYDLTKDNITVSSPVNDRINATKTISITLDKYISENNQLETTKPLVIKDVVFNGFYKSPTTEWVIDNNPIIQHPLGLVNITCIKDEASQILEKAITTEIGSIDYNDIFIEDIINWTINDDLSRKLIKWFKIGDNIHRIFDKLPDNAVVSYIIASSSCTYNHLILEIDLNRAILDNSGHIGPKHFEITLKKLNKSKVVDLLKLIPIHEISKMIDDANSNIDKFKTVLAQTIFERVYDEILVINPSSYALVLRESVEEINQDPIYKSSVIYKIKDAIEFDGKKVTITNDDITNAFSNEENKVTVCFSGIEYTKPSNSSGVDKPWLPVFLSLFVGLSSIFITYVIKKARHHKRRKR